ncbi:hypothetical protein PMAYCL1PPCAC_22585, partial [Pristionchus mayeri]
QHVYEVKNVGAWKNDIKSLVELDFEKVLSGKQIIDSANSINENGAVLNTERFGPLETVKAVIVIQVHNRLEYLKLLVSTLSKTAGIEDTLLVFSHDAKIESIDNLVRNISFARVKQIFYPFNAQLFPHIFPGQDPRDCTEKIGKNQAKATGCQNWEHPDKYGNYRSAKYSQIKHHWRWKMNYVFDGIVDRYFLAGRWVLLLEEDHYIFPDALHVLKQISKTKKTLCSECEVISLGLHLKSYKNYGENIGQLGVRPWYTSKHNMGMALQSSTWAKIKSCSELFCSWDDYNWDWSLLQVSVKCLPQRLAVIFPLAPRVLHIGDCGVHTHRCAVSNAAKMADDLLQQHSASLFLISMNLTSNSQGTPSSSRENGGWGDERDRALCRINSSPLS